LVEKIVGQFAFMICMAEPQDHSFDKLQKLNLHDVFKKADDYFCQYADDDGMILTEEFNLKSKLAEFLKEWEAITDVTAIQQNIHYQLARLDT